MKVLLNLSLISSVTLIACAPRPSTPSTPSLPSDPTATLNADVIARLRDLGDRHADELKGVLRNEARRTDLLSRGGEPGLVQLEDAVARAAGAGGARVTTHLTYGYGRNGRQPDLPAAKPIILTSPSPESSAKLATLGTPDTFVNIGCGPWGMPFAVDGLREVPFEDASVQTVRARIVQICKPVDLKAFGLHVIADKIVLKNVKLRMDGPVARQLSLVANELTLIGDTVIETRGSDDVITFAGGPGVTLSAKSLAGVGTLTVIATGANYVQKAASR